MNGGCPALRRRYKNMIRFCDKEVYTVSFEQTNRDEILDFFLRINIDQIVCVTSRDGKFNGIITYTIHSINVF